MEARLSQAQQRASHSDRALADAQAHLTDQDRQIEDGRRPTLSGLGTRVEQILRLAEEETSNQRGGAQRDAEGIVSASRLRGEGHHRAGPG